jgi:hypothetical protein
MLDYYLVGKKEVNILVSPVVQFCLDLIKDLPETGKLLASGSIGVLCVCVSIELNVPVIQKANSASLSTAWSKN